MAVELASKKLNLSTYSTQHCPLSELDEQLLDLVNGQQILFYAQGTYANFDAKIWFIKHTSQRT